MSTHLGPSRLAFDGAVQPLADNGRLKVMTGRRCGARMWVTACAAALVACSHGPDQCAPCPPPAYINLVDVDGTSPVHLVGDTAHLCIEGMACTDLTAHSGTVLVRLPQHVTPEQLDGRTVTVTVAPATDDLAQHGTAVFEYRQETGVCACSGASARVPLNGT